MSSVGYAIELRSVTRHFDQIVAVDGLSFSVPTGSITALLGANGAGKTTTISMLLGLLLPTSGEVAVLGESMRHHRYRVLPRINFSSPYVDLPMRLSVQENLTIYAHLYGVKRRRKRLQTLMEMLEIDALRKRRYGTLSAGQKTRVALAKALLNEPELLLLDEPTASLDPDMADRMRSMLTEYQRERGATILIASHNMAEVERLCDDVILMRAGKMLDRGSPAQLLQRYGHSNLVEVFLDVARHRGVSA